VTTWRGSTAGFTGTAGPSSAAPAANLAGAPGASGEEAQYLDACIAEVEAWLGIELTAYLAGAESPTELAGWISDNAVAPASAAGRRLRTASEVVEVFAAAGQGTRVRGWLREVSPQTGGRSPADLVRHARAERLLDQVREAAERHLQPAQRSQPASAA
jgi:hypothetical protein